MSKRIISALLSLAVFLTLFSALGPVAEASVFSGNFGSYNSELSDLKWNLDTVSGLLEISWDGNPSEQVRIPDFSATNAPWYQYRTSIKNIEIGTNIIHIGNNAFIGCIDLVSVEARGVVSIGNDVFNGCTALKSLDMAVYMPRVETIGEYVFRGCSRLEEITLPDELETIGFGAFVGSNVISEINIRVSNANFIIDNGVLLEQNSSSEAKRVVKAPVGNPSFTSYAIPSTIDTIEPDAFAFSRLTTITIPASVRNIGSGAFSNSRSLTEARFEGNAPLDESPWGRNMFGNVGTGFVIRYYPYATGWPTPPSRNWRDYTAIPFASYVMIDRDNITLAVGSSTQLQATVHPTSANQSVRWSSDSNPADPVATVSASGVVMAHKPGEAFITATTVDGNHTRSSRVQVVERVVPVTGITISNSNLSITIGDENPNPVLSAVILPTDATNKRLVWTSSNTNVAYVDYLLGGQETDMQRIIVPVAPGTATITVRTEDGNRSATCVVTVIARPGFIPVTNISLATTTVASGANINLGATITPSNATNALFRNAANVLTDIPNISWEIIEQTTSGASITAGVPVDSGGVGEYPGGVLSVPVGETGRVVVEATVRNGLAENVNFVQRFTINVIGFLPVTNITNVPDLGFEGIPLQLRGTVEPASASYRNIEWSIMPGEINNTAGARLDTATGILLAQWPGTVRVKATVENGRMSGTTLGPYEHVFSIRIDPYTANRLDIRANPGGTVSGSGGGQFAGGEKINITAWPSSGYIFAGWHTSNGGEFADPNSSSTQFTMPGNETTVTAFFTFIGLPAGDVGGGGGGVVLPTPVHYFTSSSVYTRHTTVSFGHVTIRDFSLFSHVTLNGRLLSRNAHYTANRLAGFTEIILANGYLDTLNQGTHTLTVHFRDNVSVSAVFTVNWPVQVSQVYDDVFSSNWFYASVMYVSDRGWMTARSGDSRRFRPNSPVTQGEVIDAYYRMVGRPTILNQHGQALQGRQAALEWVRANGIIPVGGVFNLDSAISRQDMALLLNRLVTVLRLTYPVSRPLPNFADDSQISSGARSAVNSLYRAGIINGRTESTFVPLGSMTRAEFATVLHRFATIIARW